jgi:hypothetical protein
VARLHVRIDAVLPLIVIEIPADEQHRAVVLAAPPCYRNGFVWIEFQGKRREAVVEHPHSQLDWVIRR